MSSPTIRYSGVPENSHSRDIRNSHSAHPADFDSDTAAYTTAQAAPHSDSRADATPTTGTGWPATGSISDADLAALMRSRLQRNTPPDRVLPAHTGHVATAQTANTHAAPVATVQAPDTYNALEPIATTQTSDTRITPEPVAAVSSEISPRTGFVPGFRLDPGPMSSDPRHNPTYPHPQNPGLAEEVDGFYDWAGRRLFLSDGSPDPMTPGAYRYQTRPDLCLLDAADDDPWSPRFEPDHLRHKPGDDWLIDDSRPYDVLDPGPFGSPNWFPDLRTGRHRRDELPDPIPWWEIEEEPAKAAWAEHAEALYDRRTRITREREAHEAARSEGRAEERQGHDDLYGESGQGGQGGQGDRTSGRGRGEPGARSGGGGPNGSDRPTGGPNGSGGRNGSGDPSGVRGKRTGSGFVSESRFEAGSGAEVGSGPEAGSACKAGFEGDTLRIAGDGIGGGRATASGRRLPGDGPSSTGAATGPRSSGDGPGSTDTAPGLCSPADRPSSIGSAPGTHQPGDRPGPTDSATDSATGPRPSADRTGPASPLPDKATGPYRPSPEPRPRNRRGDHAESSAAARPSEGALVTIEPQQPYRFSKLREDAWVRFLDKSAELAAAHRPQPGANGRTPTRSERRASLESRRRNGRDALDRECGPVLRPWVRLVRWVAGTIRASKTASDADARRTEHAARTARFAGAVRGAQRARAETRPEVVTPTVSAVEDLRQRPPLQRPKPEAVAALSIPFMRGWEQRFDSIGFGGAGFSRAGFNLANFTGAGRTTAGLNSAGFNSAGLNSVGFNTARPAAGGAAWA
ncbi:hypothetical protein [Glycomyces paridis]|uniref:Uncharacterized protein n=1 Tax=Glycomyces paridis TaxID=2126555 RepID=A0A4S8PHZ7_9ACTN|nr:hypothetical protein [Glycomyces paridis]THV30210.1 hypothetical protein E9998_07515 [Glycomyces paridis]